MIMESNARDTDLLVLGATGFTGKLITRYLCSHRNFNSIKLAIGARSKTRLDEVANALKLSETLVKRVIVDVNNEDSVEAAVREVKVVINAVGPYWKWGTYVVAACARAGTHYVDLTGEIYWIHEIISKFDYLASKNGSIIITSCGFDSVPSDVSCYLSVRTLKAKLGPTTETKRSVTSVVTKGGISGGTFATIISGLGDVPKEQRRIAAQDYAISPVKGLPTKKFKFLYSLPVIKNYIGGYFVMAPTNKAIVQRTWGLKQTESKEAAYGPEFTYDEFQHKKSTIGAIFTSAVILVVGISMELFSPLRWLAKKLGPVSGDGPSDEEMESGFLKLTNITSTSSIPEVHAKSTFECKGDPGYLSTAIMISEAALLLLNPSELPPLSRKGGILTPVTGLGDKYLERLEATGRFTFHSEILSLEESKKTR